MNRIFYGAVLRRRTLLTTLLAAPFAACGASNKNEAMKMITRKIKAADGVSVRYAVIGEGKPLVLLHGFSDQIESWTEFGYADALASAGRRLVLIDQRGHGGTSALHDIDAYAPARRAGDVAAVLDEIGAQRTDIFGYSMGGWTALNVARFHADRVDRLVVGGCHPFGQNMAFYRKAVAGDIGTWIGIVEQLGGPMPVRWKERVRNTDIIALRAAVAEDRPDISEALSGFERPALFFSGSEDPLRDTIARCAEFFPEARFAEIEGCNHMTAFLGADLVARRLNAFLGEQDPT